MHDVPYGFCHCGCGERTPIATMTRTERGYRKGEPQKYIHGHNGSKPLTWTVEDCGYETPCWIWGLALNPNGYGHIEREGRHHGAHRWVYEQIVGPIPAGMTIDHLCRNKPCVNPDHLEPVTHAENLRRRPCSRITMDQAREIRARVAAGERQCDVWRTMGLPQELISRVVLGKSWREE
jgi:hypothetical protein